MSDNQAKAEKLLKGQSNQSRHQTEPESKTETTDDALSLEDAIAEAYAGIENGDLHSNLTLRDENLAALFVGLDETGDLERIGSDAADTLEKDNDVTTKADALRLLVRIGLAEVDDNVIDAAKTGRKKFLASQADEF
jgi:hypothetical protein